MGVYINMEMPTSCFYCPFRIKVDPDNIKCLVSGVVFEETFTGSIEMRHSGDCPLVPVPPHGDLIDRDALNYTMLYKENWMNGTGVEAPAVWKKDIDNAPTIIPASGGTDNE